MSLTCTFKSLFIFFFVALACQNVCGQVPTHTVEYFDSANMKKDTLKNVMPFDSIVKKPINQLTNKLYNQPTNLQYPYSKKRVRTVVVANVGGYGAIMYGLNAAWYKDYPKGKFRVFKDGKEWLQMDKIGHALSAYAESKASTEVWRWTGISRNKRILLGGLSGATYQTIIEILDGYSTEWGWSWGDFGANFVGSGIFTAQEIAWDEQRIQFKFSFHRKSYNQQQLNKRSNELFGSSEPERFLKDYNGQTYWLSTNVKSFFPKSKWPAWFSIALGTGAEGMFGGTENIAKDKQGNITFYRPDIKRHRQWYLAPDIDLTKIKTRKRGVKMALNILNTFKFPMPSLEYGNNKFKLNFMHF